MDGCLDGGQTRQNGVDDAVQNVLFGRKHRSFETAGGGDWYRRRGHAPITALKAGFEERGPQFAGEAEFLRRLLYHNYQRAAKRRDGFTSVLARGSGASRDGATISTLISSSLQLGCGTDSASPHGITVREPDSHPARRSLG